MECANDLFPTARQGHIFNLQGYIRIVSQQILNRAAFKLRSSS